MLNNFESILMRLREILELFWDNVRPFFRERGRLREKINITFFIGNWVTDVLSFDKFFEKRCIFGKNFEKPICNKTYRS